jgi:hypothetical protein
MDVEKKIAGTIMKRRETLSETNGCREKKTETIMKMRATQSERNGCKEKNSRNNYKKGESNIVRNKWI